MHGPPNLATEQFRHHRHGGDDCLFDRSAIFLRGLTQHIIGNQIAVTGVTNADTQSHKIAATQTLHDAVQAIVAAVTASLLEPYRTGRQIQFIMHHQNLLRRDFVKTGQRRHCHAAAVHKYIRLQYPAGESGQIRFTDLAVKTAAGLELAGPSLRHGIGEPKAGVVPGRLIAGAGIAQPRDQSYPWA